MHPDFQATPRDDSEPPGPYVSTGRLPTLRRRTFFELRVLNVAILRLPYHWLITVNGFLKATAGAISSALIDLTSNVTGILPVANGGTGWASLAAGTVPYGNGSSALATTSPGTSGQVLALLNGIPTWVATTTLSTISGTLGVGNGGTGATSCSYGLLLSPRGSNAITNIATSSLGLLTTNVAEGSNLYYTDARVQSFVHSSTTIPKTYSSNTFTANQKICIGATCVTEAQLKALIATAAGASSPGGNEAPALAHPAVAGTQGTTTSSTSAILVVNGNNPAQWEVGQPWQDNLGALFTHDGQSEAIYSTSTIEPGALTLSVGCDHEDRQEANERGNPVQRIVSSFGVGCYVDDLDQRKRKCKLEKLAQRAHFGAGSPIAESAKFEHFTLTTEKRSKSNPRPPWGELLSDSGLSGWLEPCPATALSC